MIYEVIQTITDGLNIFFKTRLRTNEDKAVISALVNQDGSVAMLEENKVLITLVNLEREPTPVGPKKDGKQRVHINFFVLFSCYFSNANYSEALKFLAFTMNYLNDNSSMDISEGGGLRSTSSSGGLKVQIEIESLTVDQNSNLWSTIGAKYMPSALYKIRMIPLDSNSLTEFRPSAATLTGNTKQKGGGVNTQDLANTVKENTANSDSDSKQSSTSQTSPATSTTTPPPTSTEPATTKGKRPVFLSGMLSPDLDNDKDDDDDDDVVQDEETNTGEVTNIPDTNDATDLPREEADNGTQVRDNNPTANQNPGNSGIQSDQYGDTKDKEEDRPFIRDQTRNPGSFFSPLIPKKPAVPDVKPPENPVNKGTNTDNKEDPNKNLNTDSDKKS
jgi:hypothetical protein